MIHNPQARYEFIAAHVTFDRGTVLLDTAGLAAGLGVSVVSLLGLAQTVRSFVEKGPTKLKQSSATELRITQLVVAGVERVLDEVDAP